MPNKKVLQKEPKLHQKTAPGISAGQPGLKNEQTQSGITESPNRYYITVLIMAVVTSLVLGFLMLKPFIHTLIISSIIVSFCYPVYRKISSKWHDKHMLAAFVVVTGLAALVFIPLFFVVRALIPQAYESFIAVNNWFEGMEWQNLYEETVLPIFKKIDENIPFIDTASINMEDMKAGLLGLSQRAVQFFLNAGKTFLGNISFIFFHILLMLAAIFYMLINGKSIIEKLRLLSPLRRDQEEKILTNLKSTIHSVIVGTILVALIQGILGGIGFAIAGISPMVWGIVMAFTALIPIVGTGLVWVPAVFYLLITGKVVMGIFLFIWGTVVVASSDNILRPLLMNDKTNPSRFFLFLFILGGINFFGFLGLIYGPMALTFFIVMMNIYTNEFKHLLRKDS